MPDLPVFIRVYRLSEDKEILVNINSIWKIDVEYGVRSKPGFIAGVSLHEGLQNPDAIKRYNIYFGNEVVKLPANPDDPVMKILDQIYKNSIKG